MTRIRLLIYISIFLVLATMVILCIFKLHKQNNNIQEQLPTPTPTLETKIIGWDQVNKLIQECQIKIIFQRKNLIINLRDKNNQTYQSQEPKFNDVIKLIEDFQGPCDIVQTITE